jgi:hypothetical protein
MLYVSRAPLEKLQAYKRRMGWAFPEFWIRRHDEYDRAGYRVRYAMRRREVSPDG